MIFQSTSGIRYYYLLHAWRDISFKIKKFFTINVIFGPTKATKSLFLKKNIFINDPLPAFY